MYNKQRRFQYPWSHRKRQKSSNREFHVTAMSNEYMSPKWELNRERSNQNILVESASHIKVNHQLCKEDLWSRSGRGRQPSRRTFCRLQRRPPRLIRNAGTVTDGRHRWNLPWNDVYTWSNPIIDEHQLKKKTTSFKKKNQTEHILLVSIIIN